MAGISQAMHKKNIGEDNGRVLYRGEFKEDGELHKFIIVELMDINNQPSNWETIYDYGSDIRIDDKVVPGDNVKLNILDGYTAIWERIE